MAEFDVFGVGNAIVDILAQVDDAFITDCGLEKSAMTLMETERQAEILNRLEGKSLQLASGGSAANTIAAVAQSGGKAIYAGKVTADTHGRFYQGDMAEVGVDFYTEPAVEANLPTSTSVILTTPDAERTMCTHLGISTTLGVDDIDPERIANSKFCYVEGYLWTGEQTRAASLKAFETARERGVRTSFTFSDLFLVELFRDDFMKLAWESCDVIFCNADEARHFLEQDDIETCATELGKICELVFLTDGPNGCFVVENGSSNHVPGFPVKAIDTVGAGDAFAGGVLYGLTNGLSAFDSAKWGNYLASKVVEQIGPRIEQASMKDHLKAIFS